jgi:hypothetical protein
MSLDKLAGFDIATWFSFSVPLLLLVVSTMTRAAVEGSWKRKHLFIGLDLTLFFIAACFINFCDLAKVTSMERNRIAYTALLLMVGLICLSVQVVVHQTWQPDHRSRAGQIAVLCFASNFASLSLLYAFVRAKIGGFV